MCELRLREKGLLQLERAVGEWVKKLEGSETGSVIIVVDTVMGSAMVAEDNVASSVHRRRPAGSVTFVEGSKTGSVKLAKSSEVGPVKDCERGRGQCTDSEHKAELHARTETDRP